MTDNENIERSLKAFYDMSSKDKMTLADLNERIQTHTGDWGIKVGGEKTPNGSSTLPWTKTDPLIIELFGFMYEANLLPQFDWTEWEEGLKLLNSTKKGRYDQINIETALKLSYVISRKERFADGTLMKAFENGFSNVVQRLILAL